MKLSINEIVQFAADAKLLADMVDEHLPVQGTPEREAYREVSLAALRIGNLADRLMEIEAKVTV